MQDEAIQGKLQSKEKAANDLETKNKSLKSDLVVKTKQMKELEKEVRLLNILIAMHYMNMGLFAQV